jgi:hypothetical protein
VNQIHIQLSNFIYSRASIKSILISSKLELNCSILNVFKIVFGNSDQLPIWLN